MREDMTNRISEEWGDPKEEQEGSKVAIVLLSFAFIVGILFDHYFIIGYLHL
jgi:hypothetical protein